MELILAVSSLVIAGAQAASKDIGGQIVKDLYGQLKSVLSRLLGGAAKVEAVEAAPESSAAQTDLETAMREAGVAGDAEIARLAEALATALKQAGEDALARAGIEIGDVEAAQNVVIENLSAAGGVRLGHVTAKGGDAVISGIAAGKKK
jgi:hypothetical protein